MSVSPSTPTGEKSGATTRGCGGVDGSPRVVAEMGVVVTGAAGLFVATLTGSTLSWSFALSGAVLLAVWSRSHAGSHDGRSISSLLHASAVLGLALWTFSGFRLVGWATWPMQRPASVEEYAALFHMQFLLAATIGAAALWALPDRMNRTLRLGQLVGQRDAWFLFPSAALLWVTAAGVVSGAEPTVAGAVFALIPVACGKAALLSLTEEIAYRGVLLSVAAGRWGCGPAIAGQAAIFAVFHSYLTPAIVPRIPFLAAVFLLGLGLGWVAWRTRGIFWTWLLHGAVALMVEWRNIS